MKHMCDYCDITFLTATECIEHELICSGKVHCVAIKHHVLNFSFDHCGVLRTDMVITRDYGYYHKDGKYYYDIAGERKLDCVGEPTTCIGDCGEVYFCYTRTEFDQVSDEEIEDILYSLLTEHLRDMRESIDKYLLNKGGSDGNNRN